MNITAPESVEDLKRFYNEAKAGKTEGTCEIKNKFKDGYRWERLNFTSIPGKGEERTKVIVTAIDITKQKEAEKRFEEELARKSALEADSVSSITYNVSKDTIAEAVTNNGHRNIIKVTLVCPSFIQADVQKVKAVRQQDHTDLSSLQLPDLTAWWT